MARIFVPANSDGYITSLNPIGDNEPFTFSAWFNARVDNNFAVVMTLADLDGVGAIYHQVQCDNQVINVASRNGGSNQANASDSTHIFGTWNHVVGTIDGASRRTCSLNGQSLVTNTDLISTYLAANILDGLTLGFGPHSGGRTAEFDGKIAECALWDGELTAKERTMLAVGNSALGVRSNSLRWYMPLDKDDKEWIGNGSVINTSTTGRPRPCDHPKIMYPTARKTFVFAPSVVTGNPWYYYSQQAAVIGA